MVSNADAMIVTCSEICIHFIISIVHWSAKKRAEFTGFELLYEVLSTPMSLPTLRKDRESKLVAFWNASYLQPGKQRATYKFSFCVWLSSNIQVLNLF